MATVENHTGLPHFWFEQTGPEGERLDILIVRATFDFATNGDLMPLSKQQQQIVFGDKYAGPIEDDPLRAVVEEDGDLVPYKPGTDILITGRATAPNGCAQSSWLASVIVGDLEKTLRLHGPRLFRKRLFGWRLDPAEPTTHVSLDYRLAYGGCIDVPRDLTTDGEPDTVKHAGNPAGRGWLPSAKEYKHLSKPAGKHVAKEVKACKLLAAPQLEMAADPILHPYQGAAAQGLSAVARWCEPRLGLQGNFDDSWRNTRFPLLPVNFDSRYYQSASSGLVAIPHLAGNERVTLSGLLPVTHEMRLPGWQIVAVVKRASGDSTVNFPLLDTLRIDLERHQAALVWRTHFNCDDPVIEVTLAVTSSSAESDNSQPASHIVESRAV